MDRDEYMAKLCGKVQEHLEPGGLDKPYQIHYYAAKRYGRLRVFDLLALPEETTSIGEALLVGMQPIMAPVVPPRFCNGYVHVYYGVWMMNPDTAIAEFAAKHGLANVEKLGVTRTVREVMPYMGFVVLPMLRRVWSA